jgi:hypothetical protein
MNLPSRRERRALAKKFGLIKKNETLKERSERTMRSLEMGKMIHLAHLEEIENQRISKENLEKTEETSLVPSNSPDWGLADFKQQIISESNTEA